MNRSRKRKSSPALKPRDRLAAEQRQPLQPEIISALIEAATEARTHAYAPYSRFAVGAAVLLDSGDIFRGANVENASYGLTNCAERSAIFAAVAGTRNPLLSGKPGVRAVAVITGVSPPAMPCGACRQVLYEFGPEAFVISANLQGEQVQTTVSDLLPHGFGAGDLEK